MQEEMLDNDLKDEVTNFQDAIFENAVLENIKNTTGALLRS
jgi:hypothetical protein